MEVLLSPLRGEAFSRAAHRVTGAMIGVAVQLLFVVTVWYLFWFLKDGALAMGGGSLLQDTFLALFFAVPHSLLLYPPVRRRLGRVIGPAFYGLFYAGVTCVSLLLVIFLWRPVGPMLWQASGFVRYAIEAGFYASWIALAYSLHLTGLGFQTGLTPWLAWVRGTSQPRRAFAPRGAYRWMRHPVYLSFMGLLWFTPTMTLDHAVLTGVWTLYLFVGSWLKDRRLEHYLGDTYHEYQTQVTGYPLVGIGPLGKRRVATPAPQRQAA
ncbi:methyltransferase family protein [Botrimarina hoheduenensis]|uniref:NnrU protein n=1 Tax=Botrimarina hoheduenensis TaxID=2528000 RepID=A0A5C5WAQ2_9BACT|nr:NnrU family protein [Botrimarina hoheduenensis]TWT47245.1 NnrU protein [Botrimarina hoheduenensis]